MNVLPDIDAALLRLRQCDMGDLADAFQAHLARVAEYVRITEESLKDVQIVNRLLLDRIAELEAMESGTAPLPPYGEPQAQGPQPASPGSAPSSTSGTRS